MKIQCITSRHRNDFRAILTCEHCAHEQMLNTGYDDDYYHNQVLPAIKCGKCGHPRVKAPTPLASLADRIEQQPQAVFTTAEREQLVTVLRTPQLTREPSDRVAQFLSRLRGHFTPGEREADGREQYATLYLMIQEEQK